MPTPEQMQALKDFGVPLLVLLAFGYGAWKFIPKALEKHVQVTEKMCATFERVVQEERVRCESREERNHVERKEERDRHERQAEKHVEAMVKLADAVDRIGEKVNK